jgi:hypothetical protein
MADYFFSSKRFNCDIRMLSNQTSHLKPKSFDRLVLFRGADVLNITNAICHIDSLLNEMIRKRKLSGKKKLNRLNFGYKQRNG